MKEIDKSKLSEKAAQHYDNIVRCLQFSESANGKIADEIVLTRTLSKDVMRVYKSQSNKLCINGTKAILI